MAFVSSMHGLLVFRVRAAKAVSEVEGEKEGSPAWGPRSVVLGLSSTSRAYLITATEWPPAGLKFLAHR